MKFLSLKVIPAFLLLNIYAPAKAEDLMQDYASKENVTWGKANYQKITKNQNGEELKIRYFIDKKGNIYEFRRAPNYNSGPTKVGNLNEKKYSEGNTCLFGTNYECLSNITRTTYQYALKDGQLIQFSRTDYLKTNTKGDVDRSILGKKFVPITTRSSSNYDYYSEYMKDGLKYYKKEKYNEANKMFGMAIRQRPDSKDAFQSRGSTRYLLKKYDLAIDDFNKVITLNPNSEGAYLYKGLSQILSDKANEDNNLVITGCKNIIQAQKLGSKAAINFMSKKNLCQKYL